jgi:hypothetical protein
VDYVLNLQDAMESLVFALQTHLRLRAQFADLRSIVLMEPPVTCLKNAMVFLMHAQMILNMLQQE